ENGKEQRGEAQSQRELPGRIESRVPGKIQRDGGGKTQGQQPPPGACKHHGQRGQVEQCQIRKECEFVVVTGRDQHWCSESAGQREGRQNLRILRQRQGR